MRDFHSVPCLCAGSGQRTSSTSHAFSSKAMGEEPSGVPDPSLTNLHTYVTTDQFHGLFRCSVHSVGQLCLSPSPPRQIEACFVHKYSFMEPFQWYQFKHLLYSKNRIISSYCSTVSDRKRQTSAIVYAPLININYS